MTPVLEPSLFRESGGAIMLPLLVGLFLLAEVWRRKLHAPLWPQVLMVALLAPPILLSTLGERWAAIDRGLIYPTWRAFVLLVLGMSEVLLSIGCLVAGRRRWPIVLCVVSVALCWTFVSWVGAALSLGAD